MLHGGRASACPERGGERRAGVLLMGQFLSRREKSSGVWVWGPGAVAALSLLWASCGALDGEVDFPWLPGRADAAVRIPPASDSPANPAQPPRLRPPLAILGRCLLPSRTIPLLGRGGHQRWRPGGHLPPSSPLPSLPHIPHPCLPAKVIQPWAWCAGTIPT